MVNTLGKSLNHKPFPDRSIAVLGANGQLGQALMRAFGGAAVAFNRTHCDFLRRESIDSAVGSHPFLWVVNAVAYTNVDAAESHVDLCYEVNGTAVGYLAAACQRNGSRLLHVSTDYVFGGDLNRRVPYTELDSASPQSVYAKSKFAGEQAAKGCGHHLIVRTCGLYDVTSPACAVKNFCSAILAASVHRREISIVDDQCCTPTYVPHFVHAVALLMRNEARGIVHVVNEGQVTWFEFGSRLLRLAGVDRVVNPISSSQYASPATRPNYSVLDTTKFCDMTGCRLPSWEDGLAEFVDRLRSPT